MRYLLLIYGPEPSVPPTDVEASATMDDYASFTRDIGSRGIMRGGEALQPISAATTVRVRDSRTLVTDGPFAETKETLGGYYLVECADLDEAITVAARIPGARNGSIEVRPILELPGEYAMAAQVPASTAT
jgi:hypothetical protein